MGKKIKQKKEGGPDEASRLSDPPWYFFRQYLSEILFSC